MTGTVTDSLVDWRSLYLDDLRLGDLLGPGCPFEVAEIEVDGVPVRTFKRAPRSIVEIFTMGAAHEAATNIVNGGERFTFGDVRARSLSVARELRHTFGVTPGDRVALAMRNLPEFIIGFWGAAVLGATVVPLNSWWTGGELAYALENCGAKLVIADEERIRRLAASEFDGVAIATRTPEAGLHGSVAMEGLMNGGPLSEAELASPEPEDPATLLYTSGTTGRPKGAMNSHRATIVSLLATAFSLAREALITGRRPAAPKQPCSISAAPLFHIGGIASIVGAPMSGSKMVLMEKWDPEMAASLAMTEGATTLGGVPAMARELFESPGLDPARLDVRVCPLGGAAVPPDLPRRALELFGDSVQVLNGYGSSETTSAVVMNVGAEWADDIDRVGRPSIVADVQVQDEAGKPLGIGEIGELCFRSVQNATGYWNLPDATAESFVDGWFHIGDIGYVDEEGFVHVVDRLKDVVIRGGENVYCAEVEAAMFEHPDIADVAVVGLPDDAMGERVCAAVVTRPGTELTLAGLREFLSTRIGHFKRPEALYLADELPRNAAGKTEKPTLRTTIAQNPVRVDRVY